MKNRYLPPEKVLPRRLFTPDDLFTRDKLFLAECNAKFEDHAAALGLKTTALLDEIARRTSFRLSVNIVKRALDGARISRHRARDIERALTDLGFPHSQNYFSVVHDETHEEVEHYKIFRSAMEGILKCLGMRARELADATGIPPSTLSILGTAHRRRVGPNIAGRIADALIARDRRLRAAVDMLGKEAHGVIRGRPLPEKLASWEGLGLLPRGRNRDIPDGDIPDGDIPDGDTQNRDIPGGGPKDWDNVL